MKCVRSQRANLNGNECFAHSDHRNSQESIELQYCSFFMQVAKVKLERTAHYYTLPTLVIGSRQATSEVDITVRARFGLSS